LAVDPEYGRTTLTDYAVDWLAGRTELRSTTQGKYRHLPPRSGARLSAS
jgi:hypothetical protein